MPCYPLAIIIGILLQRRIRINRGAIHIGLQRHLTLLHHMGGLMTQQLRVIRPARLHHNVVFLSICLRLNALGGGIIHMYPRLLHLRVT
ncbi:MAG: hypothetical protein AAF215_32470, partial [Cyanobacteria bacterium P01_A01_bin.123]